MGDLGLAAANGLAFLLCVLFLGYVALIFWPFLRHRPSTPGDPAGLQWHFLVPCRDEEAVIGHTVRGLLDSFPTAHVWAIDDASEDGTLALLRELQVREQRVHVVARTFPNARQGKGAALNAGWRAIDEALPQPQPRDLVVVSVVDADAVLDRQVLAMVAGETYFGDPAVGAVQVQVRIRPDPFRAQSDQPDLPWRQRLLICLQDLEFTGPIAAMQMLRGRTGSVAMGGNGQFTRLSVLNQIAETNGTPWHGSLLEDFELGLHVLLAGSKTGYCHDTFVVQEGVPGLRALVRQRSRWAQGSMQCLRYLRDVQHSPHLSAGGVLEITYFLFSPWVQLLGGVVYATMFSCAAYYATTDPLGIGHWWSGGAWGLLPLFVLFGLVPFMVWALFYRRRSRPELTVGQAIGLGLVNAGYVYLNQLATWWAFYRVMTSQSDWKKTIRYSQPTPAAVAAATTRPATWSPALQVAPLLLRLSSAPRGPATEALDRLGGGLVAELRQGAGTAAVAGQALARLRGPGCQTPSPTPFAAFGDVAGLGSERSIAKLRGTETGLPLSIRA